MGVIRRFRFVVAACIATSILGFGLAAQDQMDPSGIRVGMSPIKIGTYKKIGIPDRLLLATTPYVSPGTLDNAGVAQAYNANDVVESAKATDLAGFKELLLHGAVGVATMKAAGTYSALPPYDERFLMMIAALDESGPFKYSDYVFLARAGSLYEQAPIAKLITWNGVDVEWR